MPTIRSALAGLALTLLGCADSDPQTTNHDKLDLVFKELNTGTPGCSAAAMRENEIIYTGGYGTANLDHDITIEANTVFHVASVSKQFTAAAIVLLAQDGKLSLDDDVHEHVPELPDFGHEITIRHLIHHTSGLRDQWELLSMSGWRYSRDLITNQDVLAVIKRQRELNFDPGAEFVYSNSGYTLLAEIVARVSGQSFREFTTQRIFQPLGMDHTFFRDDFREIVRGQAYGYTANDETGAYRLSVTNFDTVGATSLLTTASDLMKWQRNFDNHEVGGEALTEQMLVRGKLNSEAEIDYAFGLSHGSYRGQDTISHGGGDAGYRSFLLRFPELGFSVAVLCNTPADPGGKAFQLADLLIPEGLEIAGDDPDTASPGNDQVTLALAVLEQKQGPFWNEESSSAINFVVTDGKLHLEYGDTPYELTPLSNYRFRFEFGPLVEFDADAENVTTFAGAANEASFVRVSGFDPDESTLKSYTGTYQSDELAVLYSVAMDNSGSLTINWLKNYDVPLKPHMRDVFTTSRGTIVFRRDTESDRISGFSISTGRIRNLEFRKI